MRIRSSLVAATLAVGVAISGVAIAAPASANVTPSNCTYPSFKMLGSEGQYCYTGTGTAWRTDVSAYEYLSTYYHGFLDTDHGRIFFNQNGIVPDCFLTSCAPVIVYAVNLAAPGT